MKRRINYFLVIFLVALLFGCGHAEKITLDEEAADFELSDLRNNVISISKYKSKNPIILFFWTTWCPFCRIELKNLNQKYQQLKDKGWQVLVINVAEPVYRVSNFISRYNFSFDILLDRDGKVADAYGLLGIPTYIIVNKEGFVRSKTNYFPLDYQELGFR
jgi:peroxiredoxin